MEYLLILYSIEEIFDEELVRSQVLKIFIYNPLKRSHSSDWILESDKSGRKYLQLRMTHMINHIGLKNFQIRRAKILSRILLWWKYERKKKNLNIFKTFLGNCVKYELWTTRNELKSDREKRIICFIFLLLVKIGTCRFYIAFL